MLSQRARLLAIMLAFLFAFSSIDAEAIPEGIMPKKRAPLGTGVTTSTSTPATSNPPTTKSTSPTSPTTKKNDDSTSSQQATSTPTTVKVTTTNKDGSTVTSEVSTKQKVSSSAIETEKGTKNSVVKVGSSTVDPATLSHKTTVTHALVTHKTKQSTFTSVFTSNGHVYHSVVTTDAVFAKTTGFEKATIAPSLADGGGNGSNLSTNTKAVIGGVVGGIGGAILIGGLAFVIWRLWGKKKQQAMDDDAFGNSSHGSLTQEKRSSAMTFDTERYQDRYHNPNGAVNTASNF